jgi:hypothetical protein
MQSSTKLTLEQLENVVWFYDVGTPCEDVKVVNSWSEALQSANSLEWENFRLEVANLLSERLLMTDKKRFQLWNETVRSLRVVTDDLVARKIRDVVELEQLPDSFQGIVKWDILHLALEAEYSDVVAPSLYAGLSYWYVTGRFPCGDTTYDGKGIPVIF